MDTRTGRSPPRLKSNARDARSVIRVVRLKMTWAKTFRRLFGPRRKPYCSFCGRHHSVVAKLIAGPGCSICNECVLKCSRVLMKECDEYSQAQLAMARDFLAAGSKTEPNAPPNDGPAQASDNSGVDGGRHR